MTQKIGITGAKGFFGSHLLNCFEFNNIESIPFEGNLLNDSDIHSFFLNNNIHTLIHLAGTFFPPFQNQIDKNTLITAKVLEIGLQYGLKKIIYSSTGAIYGEPINIVMKENDIPSPNTLYGLSKYFAEKTILYYNLNHNLSYIILRFPNVYGDGNNKGVIYNFLMDIKNKKEITISGNGNQSRNFLHISDACTAFYQSLLYDNDGIFNISYPKKYSINEVAKLFSNKFNFEIKYKCSDNNLTDLLMDVSKAKRELEFKAIYSLEDYIEKLEL